MTLRSRGRATVRLSEHARQRNGFVSFVVNIRLDQHLDIRPPMKHDVVASRTTSDSVEGTLLWADLLDCVLQCLGACRKLARQYVIEWRSLVEGCFYSIA